MDMPSREASTRQPGKARKTLYDVKQGLCRVFPPEDDKSALVDIVAVPGLGAHPVDSWKGKMGFNFLTDEDGLQKDFPKSRILLYKYESAWQGPLKVKANMSNIASTLLKGLNNHRENCRQRPVAFLGHSMGGLVIAKAVTIADQHPDLYPKLFPSISGCIFFGTPFDGAPVAAVAAMYARVRGALDGSTAPRLLEMMKPGDYALEELRSEFIRVAYKLSPKVEVFCFFEQHPTDFARAAHLPDLFGLFKIAIPKKLADFVSEKSAVLPGLNLEAIMGLAADHSELVKFESFKDERYQLVRDPLKRIIHGAPLTTKNRINSTREVDRDMINGLINVLEGVNVSKKRKTLQQAFSPSPWISKEKEYLDWLAQPHHCGNPTDAKALRRLDSLWV